MADEQVMAEELTVGGRARGFSMRLPRAADGEIPLVLVLHGNHPDARGLRMREWTTFDRQADAWGFAVAYPDGCGGCWAGSAPVPGYAELTSQEFDAAEEICRFAEPRLATAETRRL
jgi:polyhydroxybutyrate depolymerase